MKALAPLLAILLATALTNAAPAAPFDMSGDRPAGSADQPVLPEEPAIVVAPKVEAKPAQKQRFLIPFQTLKLDGEFATKTWSIVLTPAEAASARKFNYGYRNAIVVAPESSKLSIYVNDTLVVEEPVQSPTGTLERSVDLPAGLLRPGANKVSFRVLQQHRTDCTLQSTYELWSEFLPEKTYLALDAKTPTAITSVEDIKAIGVDSQGRTHFNIVVPKLQQAAQTDAVMRLTQTLALLGRMPNQSFTVTSTLGPVAGPGGLTVVAGTFSDLAPMLPDLPQSAANGSFTGFIDGPKPGESILVFSGPTWQSVESVIGTLAAQLEQPEGTQRTALATQAWNGTDTPLLRSSTQLTFASLGVATTEFSGRRFRTGFDVGVPADFYANAYGEASILLDAAYSDQILPGSHIDVYVNGNIASTVPITTTNGGIFRHLPIRVTMRHFRPGANHIELEAVLQARADLACVPGASTSRDPRFALFDTSEFRMPDFARIAELPNLAAVAGTGFPYGRDGGNVALYMDRTDTQTMSATATFLGKVAVAAGHPLKTKSETSTVRIGDSNAIFVGTISQIPPLALNRVHIADESRTVWGNQAANVATAPDSKAAFDEWRSRVSGGSWTGQITALEEWVQDTFDISLGSLQFLPSEEGDTLPANSSTFMAAQGLSPDESGTWTVLAAPTPDDLRQGMIAMSDEKSWQDIAGHLMLYKKSDKTSETFPSTRSYLVPTQAFSVSNYRLIAANWLSTNILSYALLFAGFSILVGIATSVMLGSFGRRG
jgi:hypothetical protein